MKKKLTRDEIENKRATFLQALCRACANKRKAGLSIHGYYHNFIQAIPKHILRKNCVESFPVKSWERIFLTWRRHGSMIALKRKFKSPKRIKYSNDVFKIVIRHCIREEMTLSHAVKYFLKLNSDIYPNYETARNRLPIAIQTTLNQWLKAQKDIKKAQKRAGQLKGKLTSSIERLK